MATPVVVAVIVHQGRVLLVRRTVPEGRLLWQFPGGKVQPGETPVDAVVRETREETGLDVEATTTLGQRIHPLTGRHITYLACTVKSGTAHAASDREISAAVWCPTQEISGYIPDGIHKPVGDYLTQPPV